MSLTIEVRDSSLRRQGQIDDFTKLTLVMRYNAADSWILDVPADYVSELGPGAGIIVRDGTNVLLSGPVVQPQRSWSKDTDSLSVAGVSDDIIVEDRLALPAAAPYTDAAYDVRTGPAETVLKAYVDANAGPGAATPRHATGLTIEADAALGTTVTGRARFDVLGDLLRQLAIAGGDLGFRIVQDGTNLVFKVYQPVDRSADVIFSPGLGNLRAFNYTPSAPAADYVIVGGGGEGTARVFAEGGDSTQIVRWGRRVESFRDRRDTTDAGELAQSRDEELASNSEKTSLSITPIDTSAIQFIRDYYLGDRVSVVVDGTPITDVVREVKIELDATGQTTTPTVGTPASVGKDFLGIFGTVRAIRRKVGHLEGRL